MKWINILCLVLCTGLLACSDDNDEAKEAQKDMKEVGASVQDAIEKEAELLRSDVKQASARIDRKISNLQDDMEDASDQTQQRMQQQIDKLEQQQKKLQARLEEIGSNLDNSWQTFKSDVEQSLEELNRELERSFDEEKEENQE